jgi:hypothetical protein
LLKLSLQLIAHDESFCIEKPTSINNFAKYFGRNGLCVIFKDQNWAVLKLPAFIDKLQELDSDQTIDLRGSLHGQGSLSWQHSEKSYLYHTKPGHI